jgi:hypothetical protein
MGDPPVCCPERNARELVQFLTKTEAGKYNRIDPEYVVFNVERKNNSS